MNCFLLEGKNYFLANVDENSNLTRNCIEKKLPEIKKEEVTLELLKSIPNLGYIEEGSVYKLYDKTNFYFQEFTLPVFVHFFKTFKTKNELHTGYIYSKETLEAACKIKRQVEKLLSFSGYEKILENNNGIFCFPADKSNILFELIKEKKYKVWKISNDFYIVSKHESFPQTVILKVPETLIPRVIGKGGKNVKLMAKHFNAKSIKIIP